jgi:hypothetical protein
MMVFSRVQQLPLWNTSTIEKGVQMPSSLIFARAYMGVMSYKLLVLHRTLFYSSLSLLCYDML